MAHADSGKFEDRIISPGVSTRLLPLSTPELIEQVAGWLCDSRNYRWLDFGNGVQKLDSLTLKIMLRKDNHLIRVFTNDAGLPIGVIGLSNIDKKFRTASVWIVLGDKRYSKKGYAVQAGLEMARVAFRDMQLGALNVWAVECNHASLQMIQLLKFNYIGRQRKCHYIDNRPYDRLWFDILVSEYNRYQI